jgi:hypothetical protein
MMTDKVLVNGIGTSGTDTIEQFYPSPDGGNGTIITAFSAINDTGVNASYKAYIFDKGASTANPIIPFKIVIRKTFDVGPSITNQLIPAGGTLRMETSAINSIVFRVSGVEL